MSIQDICCSFLALVSVQLAVPVCSTLSIGIKWCSWCPMSFHCRWVGVGKKDPLCPYKTPYKRLPLIILHILDWDPVHATPEEFENAGFTLKTRQMFFVHTTPEELKNATITGHFGFVFEENSGREITWLSWRHRFRKAPFWKCFLSTRAPKAGVFKFPRFEERFRDGLVWTVKFLRRSVDAAWVYSCARVRRND